MAKISADQAAKEEIITVTGSTIERKTLTTPAPLTVLSREDLKAAGRATVGDILQQLPEQSNAVNAQSNNGGEGSTRISIRGLGANRTLTLLNGRRVVAGGNGANNSVDLNAIPLAMIERVEVLKDGASAVYGSDAIGGVVNIITRSDFTGTEVALYTGEAAHGDGFTYDGSFVTGYTSQDKRGNIVFSAGIQSQDAVMAGDRSFSNRLRSFDYTNRVETTGNITTAPSGYLNAKAGIAGPNGKAAPRDVCGADFCTSDGNGGFRPFMDSDLYNPQPDNYLYTPSSRYNLYSSGTYKIAPNIGTFFEASYLNRTSDQRLAPTPFSAAATISKDSMYNHIGADVLDYQRRLSEFGPRAFFQSIDTFRIVGGLQGTIPGDSPAFKDWKWEASYNYGHTGALNRNQGNLIKSRLAQALGPSMPEPGTGKPICVRTPNDPKTVITGCVPMNILGPAGSIDPAAASWATFTGVSSGFNQQQTVLAQGHGKLIDLPNHGDLSMAVGADYRMESGGTSPDPLTATGDTTGNAQLPTGGKYNVAEGFSELSLVPFSGGEHIQWTEIDLAARAFRYNTFGKGVTWKAGGLLRLANGFAVRGTYSTAFRAPSIFDLFQGTADAFPTNNDPCNTAGGTIKLSDTARAKCEAQGVDVASGPTYADKQQRTVVGGNPTLKAETAKVATAGVVYEPPWLKGVSLTADLWRIDITDAIQQLPASVILSNCYVQGLDDFCKQIHRNPMLANKIDFVTNTTQNVGGTSTSGLDLAAAYEHSFGDPGRLRASLEGQYLGKYNVDNSVQILHYRGNYDFGVFPKYKANFATQWAHPSGVGAGLNIQYIGSFKECNNKDCNHDQPARDVAAWAKLDLYGSYAFKSVAGGTTFAVGVNNVTNKLPAVIYAGFAGTSDSGTYDYMGRFIYTRIAQSF